jgi:heparin binding hemagglutinin HbhA
MATQTSTRQTTTRRIPEPLYAAAGAGDLAYQQLRKLPERVAELRGVDIERLRDAARRNAAALVSGVEAAQERATAVYTDLVKRGHRVVRNARTTQARVEIAPAKAKVITEVASQPARTPRTSPAKSTPARSTATKSTAAKRTRTTASSK